MNQASEGRAVADEKDEAEDRSRRPDWFHRGHPVFFPLAGFFTGMVSIIVVPGLYAGILRPGSWATTAPRNSSRSFCCSW